MKPILTLVAIVLVSQPATADCQNASDNVRKCYDNSNAPRALVYQFFVREIFSDSLQSEEDRLGWHYVEAGLTTKMNADDVIEYFVPKYLEIEKEVETAQKQMLCKEKEPRYEGAQNFIILNEFDEMSLAIYEKHRLLAKSDLSASGLFDLDTALDEYPASFMSMFMDQEKTRNGSIDAILKTATTLCKEPWGHSFSHSHSRSVESD